MVRQTLTVTPINSVEEEPAVLDISVPDILAV